jgi:hypothetical protein
MLSQEHIMNELIERGPAFAGMDVMADFTGYTGGVYTVSSSENVGGHAVKLFGWGVDSESGIIGGCKTRGALVGVSRAISGFEGAQTKPG